MSSIKPWQWIAGAVAIAAVGVAAFWLTRGPDGVGTRAVPKRSSSSVLIATFNVGGLYDLRDDPRLDADDEPTRIDRLLQLSTAIHLADADVLALQDVESLDAVESFRDDYLNDLGYDHVISIDVGHHEGAENAVLSRFPLRDAKVWPTLELAGTHPRTVHGETNPHAGEPLRFRCSPLMVTVILGDAAADPLSELVLVNLDHKGGDRYRYWREAEAAALAKLLEPIAATRPVILLGSFHDERGSTTVDTYLEAGFKDVFRGHGEAARVVTEASGDRTDLILVTDSLEPLIDTRVSFVLGDAASKELEGLDHFPVVASLSGSN